MTDRARSARRRSLYAGVVTAAVLLAVAVILDQTGLRLVSPLFYALVAGAVLVAVIELVRRRG